MIAGPDLSLQSEKGFFATWRLVGFEWRMGEGGRRQRDGEDKKPNHIPLIAVWSFTNGINVFPGIFRGRWLLR